MAIQIDSSENTRSRFNNILTGIDRPSAFDTIWWNKLIEITEAFLAEDKMRILRVLPSDTNLEIKIQGADTKPIQSNIRSPQGDDVTAP